MCGGSGAGAPPSGAGRVTPFVSAEAAYALSYPLMQPVEAAPVTAARWCNYTEPFATADCVHPPLSYTGLNASRSGSLPWSPVITASNLTHVSWTCGNCTALPCAHCAAYEVHLLDRRNGSRADPTPPGVAGFLYRSGRLTAALTHALPTALPAYSLLDVVVVAHAPTGAYDVAVQQLATPPASLADVALTAFVGAEGQPGALIARAAVPLTLPDTVGEIHWRVRHAVTNATVLELVRGGALPLNCVRPGVAFTYECFTGLLVGPNVPALIDARMKGAHTGTFTQWLTPPRLIQTATSLQPPPDVSQGHSPNASFIRVAWALPGLPAGHTVAYNATFLDGELNPIRYAQCTAPCDGLDVPDRWVGRGSADVHFVRVAVLNDRGLGPSSFPVLLANNPAAAASTDDNLGVAIGAAVAVAVAVVAGILLLLWWRYRRQAFVPMAPDAWEVRRQDFEVIGPIGAGAQGTVVKVRARVDMLPRVRSDQLCVMKELNSSETAQFRHGFTEEMRYMKIFTGWQHPNFVQLYGVVTQSLPLAICMEHVHYGSMRNYVRMLKNVEKHLTTERCLQLLRDVACGMEMLNVIGFTHRDLAARNCLVAQDGTVKICDFGMTRGLDTHEYYRPKSAQVLMPVRWCAPETLNTGRYFTQSDVWSFGVVAWEVFTGGDLPFAHLDVNAVMDGVVNNNLHLPRPELCPDEVWDNVVLPCHQRTPDDRPTFVSLHKGLCRRTGATYVDYSPRAEMTPTRPISLPAEHMMSTQV